MRAAAASAAGAVARPARARAGGAAAAAHDSRVRGGLFRLLRHSSPGRGSGRPRRPFELCVAPEALLR